MVPFSKRALRATLVPLGLCVALAAVPTVASASIGLGAVVSSNPANVTPNVASGAVHKLLQVGGTMYAGGAFSSVSTPAGVSPCGTFARSNLVAFNASTGVVASFAPSVNGEVWAMASDGASLWIGGTFTSVNGVARRGVANNPQGAGTAGPGAVSRPGIGAIHPTTGLALPWNPTKDRGVGGKDLYVTSQGCGSAATPTASAARPAAASPCCRSPSPGPRPPGRRGGWCAGPWPARRPRWCREPRRR